ncbi:alpha/beta hydrolase [Bosea beijingensis]|uniref:alpha/beta hydrolase n=1 Tax=Bosea beijingensis TaxID=3068632 RepID=UPI00274158A5|nr:alpha/beta hydrolase [Bosea sp. REN20]
MTEPAARVYLDYDQARLDLNYNQVAWAPNAEEIIAWYRSASLEAHRRLACRHLAYGEGPAERIDLFPAASQGAPLVVYVHGGAWRMLDRMDSAFAAEAFVGTGLNFAVLDFASIPAARLPEMVMQVQRGIRWLVDHAEELGFDRRRLFVIGHSSGAHLVSAALTADTPHRIEPGLVAGALCASGAYDLEGPMLSARGSYLGLIAAEIETFSPIRHAERLGCPVLVAYGDGETDEYRRHAVTFHAALRKVGATSALLLAPGQNHFEVSRTLASRDSALFAELMKNMTLAFG